MISLQARIMRSRSRFCAQSCDVSATAADVAPPIRPIQISAALRMARRPCLRPQVVLKRFGFTQLGQLITRLKLPVGKIDRSNFKMEVQCPPTQTFTSAIGMAALGHKRTYAPQKSCPLCPRKQTLRASSWNVRFVPIADIPASQRDARLPVDIYRAGGRTMASTDLQKSTAA